MSTHSALLAYLADHPESCIHALQVDRHLPLLDLQTIHPVQPPRLRLLADGRITALQSDLAWLAQFGPTRQQALLLVDAVECFEHARVWTWPRLRAGVRLQVRCPTWMLVYSPRPSVLAAIDHGFAYQRELMPILFGLDTDRTGFEPTTRRPPSDPALDHEIHSAHRLTLCTEAAP